MTAYYQVAVAKTGVLTAPNTYHASRELAEQAMRETERTVPDLKGLLIVVPAHIPESDPGLGDDL